MAYDSIHRQTVLFGGYSEATQGPLGDTWVWDGSNWMQKFPAHVPAARYGHAMAYDAVRGKVLMFGGAFSGNDTWVWDGTDWAQQLPLNSPPLRAGHAMAYDPDAQNVLLFGGSNFYTFAPYNDTWIWDGTNWVQMSPPDNPSPRQFIALAYEQTHSQLVLFGGYNGTSLNDTWTWDGANWNQQFPSHIPPLRYAQVMATDTLNRRVLMFGGVVGSNGNQDFANDTWVWTGSDWTQQFPATSPSPRAYAAGVYDARRLQVLLFGGSGGNLHGGAQQDTWNWALQIR
jgi:hypothetical protein